MKVTFCGLGRMGLAMAAHVQGSGHELTVWNRTPGRAGDLAPWEASSLTEGVSGADVVVLMLFGPDSVRDLMPELLGATPKGALVLDATTIGPDAAREFGALCAENGLRYADAPVAGSVKPATDGTLGVLVGCAESDWDQVREIALLWGDPERVRRLGEVGAGNAAKLVINASLSYAMAGLGECLRLGRELGVDAEAALGVLSAGPLGWTIAQKRQMLLDDDYSATTFSLDLMAKDVTLALEAGETHLSVLAAIEAALTDAQEAGFGGSDYAALAGHLAAEDHLPE